MAGIYIHVPFCRKACTYCDFHFSTNLSLKQSLAEAIAHEAKLQQGFFAPETVLQTIYFGGGTPSLLNKDELSIILDAVREVWQVEENAEITLEANPDDLSEDLLSMWQKAGINRLSIGVQSFRQEDLELLNRSHNAGQALNGIRMAQAAGFHNLTVDLIYGIPGLSKSDWLANVRQLISLGIPHVSAYALTVEEKTTLSHQVAKGQVQMPADTDFTGQYDLLIAELTQAGFEHYELSNFAKADFRSRHNSAYWSGTPYLGLGPSAHSHRENTRHWNVANNALYLKSLSKGELAIAESEALSPTDRLNEYFLTHLRLSEGLDSVYMKEVLGYDLEKEASQDLQEFIRQDWMEHVGSKWRLTASGKMVSNHIISELFVDGEV